MAAHEPGVLKLRQVHVEQCPRHPHPPGEFTHMQLLTSQQRDDAHALLTGNSGQAHAKFFCRH